MYARAVISVAGQYFRIGAMDVVYSNYRFIEPELAFEEYAARDDKVLTKKYSREHCTGTLSFHDISYVVEQTQSCFKKRSPKVILNNVR